MTGRGAGGLAVGMQTRGEGPGARGSYRFDFTGATGHDAATPSGERHDPLLTFAMTVLAADKQARLGGHKASFGRVEVAHGQRDAPASRVTAWLNARSATAAGLDALVAVIRTQAEQRAERDGTQVVVAPEPGHPVADPVPVRVPLPVPVLQGALVRLRPHRAADLDAVLARSRDPESQRWTTIPADCTREMAEEYLAGLLEPSSDEVSWAIEVEGDYAGTIDLRTLPVDGGAGDLGFVTHPAFRGRGVMSEAVGLVVQQALDVWGWQLVRWQAHAGNWASAKAVWRNGFPLPVFVPDLLLQRGRAVDGWMSTLRRDGSREPVAAWDDVVAALN